MHLEYFFVILEVGGCNICDDCSNNFIKESKSSIDSDMVSECTLFNDMYSEDLFFAVLTF